MAQAKASETYRARIGAWVKARLLRDPNAVQVDCPGLDLFVVKDVLGADECSGLMRLIDADLAPSRLMAPTDDREFRTSQSCDLDLSHPLVVRLEERIGAVMGIQAELGESVQGQRYRVGQQFKPHFDYFHPTEAYWPHAEKTGGQRTWTAMLFLNEPEAGGQTCFPEVGVSIRPRAGNLLVWNNLTAAGELNPLALHQGRPVEAGVKYVVTKWYRERRWTPLPADVPLY